jgi:hypothetical protein
MLNHNLLKDSLPTGAALKSLDAHDQAAAAGRAIGVVLKTMKYSHYEPDRWETKHLVAALADLQGGFPLAAISELDHALESHSDRSPAGDQAGASMPVDTLIQRLDSIYRPASYNREIVLWLTL